MKALIIIFAGAIITLFAGVFGQRKALPWLAGLTTIAALAATIADLLTPHQEAGFPGMMSFDTYSLAFTAVLLLTAALIILLSGYSFRNIGDHLGDHYGLILFSLCGAICMVSYDHLVMLFLGIEILSIPMYVLAGSRKNDLQSNEASLKYFIMGAFTTGILLLGITLIYGATGSFSLEGIGLAILNGRDVLPPFFKVGVLLFMVGLSFKVSAVPFHFWAPDVYQGSPSTITLYMSTVVKVAAFAAFFRIFNQVFSVSPDIWQETLMVISGATMLLANIMATRQADLKRLLAYSSISHAGFMLMAIVSLRNGGASVLWMYAIAYSLASVAVFSVLIPVQEQTGQTALSSFRGLGKKQPLLAAVVAIALFSMAGIPPTGGFFAKYFMIVLNFQPHFWLVIAAVIASAISAYYYLKIAATMFFEPPVNDNRIILPAMYIFVQLICITGIFLLAVFAQKALVFLLF